MIDAGEARKIIKTVHKHLPENFRNDFEVYECSSWVGILSAQEIPFKIYFNDYYPNILTPSENEDVEEAIKTGLKALGYKITREVDRVGKSYYFEKSKIKYLIFNYLKLYKLR